MRSGLGSKVHWCSVLGTLPSLDDVHKTFLNSSVQLARISTVEALSAVLRAVLWAAEI